MTAKRNAVTPVEPLPAKVPGEVPPAGTRQLGTGEATAPARVVEGSYELIRIRRELTAARRLLYAQQGPAPAPGDVAAMAAEWTAAAEAVRTAMASGNYDAYRRAMDRLNAFEDQAKVPPEPDALSKARRRLAAAYTAFGDVRAALQAGEAEKAAVLAFICGRELQRAYRRLHRQAAAHGHGSEGEAEAPNERGVQS